MAVVVIILLSLLSIVHSQEGGSCPPTPANYRTLFIEECDKLSTGLTCTNVWDTYSGSFAGIAPLDVHASNYIPYFDLFPITPNPNTSLFWSRTPNLVKMLSCMCSSGADIVSSANIFSTEIVNNVEIRLGIDELRWCGTTEPSSQDGIEYTMNCPCSASFDFFEQFSINFARGARGTIFYLGYGERTGGTFSEDSFFAQYELPQLNTTVVTNAVVLVVHREGEGESCGQGSLVNLRAMMENRGISYTCYDVFGNINEPSQIQPLSDCAMGIIASIQQGLSPEDNCCFKPGGSSGTTVQVSVVILAFSLLVMLLV